MNRPCGVLVVGGTRILRPAVQRLAAAGRDVVPVARTRSDLEALAAQAPERIHPVVFGYLQPSRGAQPGQLGLADLERIIIEAGLAISAALLYAPAADPSFFAAVRQITAGPVVQLLVSAQAAGPNAEFSWDDLPAPPAGPWFRLLLGWTSQGRWHSPEQISAASLNGLARRQDAILGRVRPWADRPI